MKLTSPDWETVSQLTCLVSLLLAGVVSDYTRRQYTFYVALMLVNLTIIALFFLQKSTKDKGKTE